MGTSLGSGGDVDRDGFSDVVVGAPLWDNGQTDEGRVLAYQGSALGLGASPSWTVESNFVNAQLGHAVSAAGDVDGDGYADLLVGSPHDGGASGGGGGGGGSGHVPEGRTFLFYGNGGRGVPVLPRQRRASGAAPIAPLGASDSPSAFRLGLLGRSPFGRSDVRLEWELEFLGTSLDGAGTDLTPGTFDTGTAGASIEPLLSGLPASSKYHWRLRVRYDPVTTPLATRGRWITIPWGGWNESMLRTPGLAPGAGDVLGLALAKAPAGQITLTWGASCTATDTDYGVYEGTVGVFYSHQARACSTGGARAATLTPQSGSAYYLIVPRNAGREGSYGRRSTGVERPGVPPVCAVQALASCP